MISVIIPTIRPTIEMTSVLIEVESSVAHDTEVILVSTKGSAAVNRNIGLNKAKGEFIIMCDDDVRAYPTGWDVKLVDSLKVTKANVVGARLLGANGKPHPVNYGNYDLSKEHIQVRGMITACCVFRRTSLRFDEKFVGSGWEDTDFFQRMGDPFFVTNTVMVVHLNEHKNPSDAKNASYYRRKWL